jgi:hypothetical protein
MRAVVKTLPGGRSSQEVACAEGRRRESGLPSWTITLCSAVATFRIASGGAADRPAVPLSQIAPVKSDLVVDDVVIDDAPAPATAQLALDFPQGLQLLFGERAN